tara:strand:- start:59360 stop:60832 length:1473 start_codon:yes stop_codon:yes gene_type:complete
MSNSPFLRALTNPSKAPNLAALAIFLLALVVIFVFDFNGLIGQDTHEYYRFSHVISDFLLGKGDMEGFYWTIMYPFIGALSQMVTGESPYALQVISLLSHIGSAVFLLKYIQRNHIDKAAIIVIVVGYVFCPVMLKNGFHVMSEPLTVFFLCGSIYYFNEYSKYSKLKHLTYWFFFAAFAVFTRYPVFILLVPQSIFIFLRIVKLRKYQYLAIGALAIFFASLPEMLISVANPEGGGLFDNYFLKNWSFLNLFKSSFLTADGTQVYALPNILFASKLFWYPVFFTPFFFLLFWSKKSDFVKSEYLIYTSSVVLYLLFSAGFPFQNIRILVPAFPFLIILSIRPFVRFWNWKRLENYKAFRNGAILLFLTAQLFLFFYLINTSANRNHFEKEVAAYIESLNKERYFGYDIDVAVNSYLDKSKKIENLIIELHEFREGDVLFFNRDQYEKVWTKSNVHTNIQRALYAHDTVRIRGFGSEWSVYELIKKEENK